MYNILYIQYESRWILLDEFYLKKNRNCERHYKFKDITNVLNWCKN